MPNYDDTENLFFSWNMGPVHFISVSTESYYFVQYGLKPLSRQYQWLIEDLEVCYHHNFTCCLVHEHMLWRPLTLSELTQIT